MEGRRPHRTNNEPRFRRSAAQGSAGRGPQRHAGDSDVDARPASPLARSFSTGTGRFNPRRYKKNIEESEHNRRNFSELTSDLQLTDGRFFGTLLSNSDSPRSAPIARGTRSTMFRILSHRVRGARFLDLCSGCGSVGIEALSRGAMLATFVDRSPRIIYHVESNLNSLGIKPGHGEFHTIEAEPFLLRSAKKRRHWDIAFVDISQHVLHDGIFEHLSRGYGLRPGGMLLLKHPPEIEFRQRSGRLNKWRELHSGQNKLTFYDRI